MKLVIPAYVDRREEDEGPRYWATPVFWQPELEDDGEERSGVSAEDALEDRAVKLLEKNLTELARQWAVELDHDALVRLAFSPVCRSQLLKLRLELRRRTLTGDFLAVSYESAGRRLVVIPRLRGVCFEWKAGRICGKRRSGCCRPISGKWKKKPMRRDWAWRTSSPEKKHI